MEQEKHTKQEKGKVVTFEDLWSILTQKLWIIVAGALVGTLLLLVVIQVTYTPRYESKAILYITRQSENTSFGDASTEFSLSLKLVNDCTYFLKSHTVLDQVIQELNLDLTYRQLYNSVVVNNPENTRILEVVVEADSPEEAKRIVDRICGIVPHEIEDVMGYKQVQQFEGGTLNTEPCNRTGAIVYLLAFAVLAAALYSVFLVIDLLDDRIRSDEDIERILGLSVLGNIPDAAEAHRNRYGYYAYRHEGKRGEAAVKEMVLKLSDMDNFFVQEAYKTLRTNLQFCGQDIQVLVFTSVHENEGKSTISLQTAKSMAELGKKVLLIDADLRKLVMAGKNSNIKKTVGLSEVLSGMNGVGECLYQSQYQGLHVLFSGKYPPNPVELLGSKYFAKLISEARDVYDYVIVDTPPLGMVIDAAVIAPLCDGAVLVVGNNAHASDARSVISQLEKANCKVLGAVRNNARIKHRAAYK